MGEQQKWNNDIELALGLAKESEESLGYELQLVSERTQSMILKLNERQGKWNNDVEVVLGLAKENDESLGYELKLALERTRLAEEGLKELQSQVHAIKPVSSRNAKVVSAFETSALPAQSMKSQR